MTLHCWSRSTFERQCCIIDRKAKILQLRFPFKHAEVLVHLWRAAGVSVPARMDVTRYLIEERDSWRLFEKRAIDVDVSYLVYCQFKLSTGALRCLIYAMLVALYQKMQSTSTSGTKESNTSFDVAFIFQPAWLAKLHNAFTQHDARLINSRKGRRWSRRPLNRG